MALHRLWNAISEALFGDTANSRTHIENVRTWAQIAAPVVWLLGKTGAGKTAIVSALTGDTRAAIGEGFAPCTRSAAFYDVPAEAPLLRFLDTRGLGEVDYDPAADIAWCEGRPHLLLVAMQVADPAQDTVCASCSWCAAAIPSGRLLSLKQVCIGFIPRASDIPHRISSRAAQKPSTTHRSRIPCARH